MGYLHTRLEGECVSRYVPQGLQNAPCGCDHGRVAVVTAGEDKILSRNAREMCPYCDRKEVLAQIKREGYSFHDLKNRTWKQDFLDLYNEIENLPDKY